MTDAWKPGDPLPDAEHGLSRLMMQVIDDDGLGCHEPVCWCLTGLARGDLRAMRWYPGLPVRLVEGGRS